MRQLYLGRQPLERIAKRFATTKDNIRQKAHRLGLKRPRPKDAPKHDMASRLWILLGKEVRPPWGRRLFSDAELLRFAGRGLRDWDPQSLRRRLEAYVLDPLPPLEPLEVMEARGGSSHSITSNAWPRLHGLDLFCREAVGLELIDHQLAMAACCLASKRAVCLAGRQCGKDVTQAALALWEGVVQPNALIVIVSGAQRQSDALMEKALGFVARNEKLFDSVLRSSRETLELTNGSFIEALPATGLIRGETATRVLVNEARDILNVVLFGGMTGSGGLNDETWTYRSLPPVAYRLVLNRLVRKVATGEGSGILILDEPTDGFSKEQLGRVGEILDELGNPQITVMAFHLDALYSILRGATIGARAFGEQVL